MNEINLESNNYLCHCTCTTEKQILALIQDGADTLEKISFRSGAASGCGACETWIEELLIKSRFE